MLSDDGEFALEVHVEGADEVFVVPEFFVDFGKRLEI